MSPQLVEHSVSGRWRWSFLAWLTTLVATAGALFLGEVMGKTPCVLCWYQRIAMFPLPLILGIGLLESDRRSIRYAMPLAVAGWCVATYHCLIFMGWVNEALVPCGTGASCAASDLQVAGVVPIPLLSLVAFIATIVLLWMAKRETA